MLSDEEIAQRLKDVEPDSPVKFHPIEVYRQALQDLQQTRQDLLERDQHTIDLLRRHRATLAGHYDKLPKHEQSMKEMGKIRLETYDSIIENLAEAYGLGGQDVHR